MGGPWEDYGSAPNAKEGGPWSDYAPSTAEAPKPQSKIMTRMDELARSQGYKDYGDQSAKIGQGVMGGQIASLAGPAMAGLSKLLGRGGAAAAETAPAAAESVGPYEAAYSAAARAGSPATSAAGSAAPAASGGIRDAILGAAGKIPLVKTGLGLGGIEYASGGHGPVGQILHHPELAAGAGALALASTPLGGIAESAVASQLAKEQAEKSPDARLQGLKGEAKWTMSGFQNVLSHDPSGALSDEKTIERAFASPKIRQLLVQASDLKPGSKAMQNVYDQIQSQLKGAK